MPESKLVMLAGGGHARVLIDAVERTGACVSAILDPGIAVGQKILGVSVVGDESWLSTISPLEFTLVNGIGAQPRSTARQSVYDRCRECGFSFATVLHPAAVISVHVELCEGAQLMAGAIVQCSARVGVNTILNTGSRIDHDCEIADHAFVGPGAILCGNVHIGRKAFVGAGAVVLQGRRIGADAVVAAGAVVTKDVPDGSLVKGNPAGQM
ncbi:acetyltransferase [Solidesulfovibrio fructosivorans]|nr:acetyltransferase [Solidesulfovibrio fructosivorans]